MKVVVTHLGGPCFMSHENQAWLAGLRTPVLKTMRLAVGNGWFHESSLESIEIT